MFVEWFSLGRPSILIPWKEAARFRAQQQPPCLLARVTLSRVSPAQPRLSRAFCYAAPVGNGPKTPAAADKMEAPVTIFPPR